MSYHTSNDSLVAFFSKKIPDPWGSGVEPTRSKGES